MSRQSESPKKPEKKTEKKLVPHLVIIDGEDRTIMASDKDDLQKKVAKLQKEKTS